jgi:hypothetical protein
VNVTRPGSTALFSAIFVGWLSLAAVLLGGPAGQETRSAPPAFGAAWRVLVGDWVSVEPAPTGSGASSFRFELDGHAIVRRNRAEVTSGAAKTAKPHEDLMVVYPTGPGDAARALYVDNEGHVIQYAATWSPDFKVLTFLSDAVPGAPRFRLTYQFQSASEVSITFEIASPDSPAAFKPYVTGRARRTAAAPAR